MNLKNNPVLLLVLLTAFAAVLGAAEIYVREGPEGGRIYSDKPSPDSKLLSVRAGVRYRVVRHVYDGDTLLLDDRTKVRLLGINTPEVESSRKSGEPGGEEARSWLKTAIEGRKILLEQDVERSDRYKRTLAQVFTEDGVHINRELVRAGLATVNIHPPNLKYAQRLIEAERLAQAEGLGIWGDPAYAAEAIENLNRSNARGWHRLVGRPIALKRNRKYMRLIYSERVDVRISRENLDLFPDLNEYLGRDTEIRGWPSRRKDHYSILVRHPSALRVLNPD
jgi:micrococcal nuclease